MSGHEEIAASFSMPFRKKRQSIFFCCFNMFRIGQEDSRAAFLAQVHSQSVRDEEERIKNEAVLKIQAATRSYLSRSRLKDSFRSEFDDLFSSFKELDKTLILPETGVSLRTASRLIFIYHTEKDLRRFHCLCRYLLLSLESSESKHCIIHYALSKDHLLKWMAFMKKVLVISCKELEKLTTDLSCDLKSATLYLHVMVSFTACNTWPIMKTKKGDALKPSLEKMCSNILNELVAKGMYSRLAEFLRKGLCRTKPTLKNVTLSAGVTLCMRPLLNCNFSEPLLCEFIGSIVSIPAFFLHLQNLAQECLALMMSHHIFERSVCVLGQEHSTKMVFNSIDGTAALSLLANIIHLGSLEKEKLVENLLDFANVMTRILEKCRDCVVGKKNQMNHWHPVLGWFSLPLDNNTQASLPLIVQQLQNLWSASLIRCLFKDLPNNIETVENNTSAINNNEMAISVKNLWKKLQDKQQSSTKLLKRLGSPEVTIVALVCSLYHNTLTTFTQLRYDILSGLCYQDFLLPRLWTFISSMSPQFGLKAFLELLVNNPKATSPEFQILILFADCATYLITILDDLELYEQQKPFTIDQLAAMGFFCNQFLFKSVWEGCIDVKSVGSNTLWKSVHGLLMLLYQRDCRRSFTSNTDFWLIKDIKPSSFVHEYYEKKNKKAELLISKMPHIIPHKERVILFRRYVMNDREALGLSRDVEFMGNEPPTTLISVHRPRLVEDGYRQLSLLPVNSLKGVVRVKFVNEQGLDEAGIDQDGVFKEFLEETIKKVFDPALNLFKMSSDGALYPSSTSNIHENHLALFDFVGRMLGKAVYEGIISEVPFATFFLSHVLGKSSGAGYSSVDELPSLDPELYKNLTYIKHYDGDMSDLELTFAYNEEYMGQMMTHDLVPGGRTISVNNENKISYIHHMAHFRMNTQIRDQTTAFVRGFRALIKPEWLALFSPQEANKLISGDSEDIDIADLRRHTQYYGGFHNGHKVINWLWQVLQNDFTREERKLFLKFVTSCSKPPLLGFQLMEPQFSIRCVEVADDHDTGDTVGSMIRGFLSIKKRENASRLPTSSTCFNLLKLPNYTKKSTLRDKLRYAISSQTGFELS